MSVVIDTHVGPYMLTTHYNVEVTSVQNTCKWLQSQSLISLNGVQKHFSRSCSRECNKYGDRVNVNKKCNQKVAALSFYLWTNRITWLIKWIWVPQESDVKKIACNLTSNPEIPYHTIPIWPRSTGFVCIWLRLWLFYVSSRFPLCSAAGWAGVQCSEPGGRVLEYDGGSKLPEVSEQRGG